MFKASHISTADPAAQSAFAKNLSDHSPSHRTKYVNEDKLSQRLEHSGSRADLQTLHSHVLGACNLESMLSKANAREVQMV